MLDQTIEADILIVDDTPDNIRFLSSLLVKRGYKVRKALNGKMALVAARTLVPDLILLDINMPEMDGYEVCKRLKDDELTRSIPVIFLSAWGDADDKIKAFQSGGVDYITKPFQFEEVLIRIQNQLTIQNLQNQLQTQNSQLKRALATMTQNQLELVQHEKTVSLNRLATGMINGIDHPLRQISSDLALMQALMQDSFSLLQLIQPSHESIAELLPDRPDIASNIESISLTAVLQNFAQAIHSIQTKSEQIQAILLAARCLANLEGDIRSIDIHEMIDHIVLLLEPVLIQPNGSGKIKLVQDYGHLLPVRCSVSLLNQVVFNLLSRAIDELEFKMNHIQDATFQPTIFIKTEMSDSKTVKLHIQDNGPKTQINFPEESTELLPDALANCPISILVCYHLVKKMSQARLTYQMLPDGSKFTVEMPV